MSSIGSILNIARSAITAHQTAIRVASHNISNAQTDGYSRQRASFVDAGPDITPLGRMGAGVRVFDIQRLRDSLLDIAYRRESGRSTGFELRHSLTSQVEQVLGEPSERGVAASLDAFFSSWSELANQPTSDAGRRLVVQSATHVASMLQGFSSRLQELGDGARLKLTTSVQDANSLAKQIASVNHLIVREEAGGTTASDLRDHRDRLLDAISQLGSVRVVDRGPGGVAVLLENAMVVDGPEARTLTVTGEPPQVMLGTRALTFTAEGSAIGELVAFLGTGLPQVQGRLDELARGLVLQVNAIHNSGFQPDGTPGGNFFDPAGLDARTITVTATSATVAATDVAGETGNNRIALAMAALRGDPAQNTIAAGYPGWAAVETALGGMTFGDHYRATVTGVAVDVRQSRDQAEVFLTLAEQAETRRSSVSGVSTDEELVRIIQHQHAYTAAARMVSVVDEMMQTVLNMIR